MNELALFSGAGGGILAAKLLGWRTVCAVELDTYRCERLAQRQNEGFLPPFPIWNGDITAFDGKPWRGIADVVSGGFPCQDISGANPNAEGITGSRSGLWKEMFRIVRESGPGIVWLENSPMLTSRGLGVVLGDLASLGYNAEWGVLGADDLGGFHRRERIFIMGYTDSFWKSQQERSEPEIGRRIEHSSQGSVGNADRKRLQRLSRDDSGDRGPNETGHSTETGVRILADLSRNKCDKGQSESEGKQGGLDSSIGGQCRQMADRDLLSWRTKHEQQISDGARARQQSSGDSEDVENPNGSMCDRRTEDARGIASGRITLRGGGSDGVWGDVELIECRDGKIRATKPGLCGVAHGMANRVDRISAIGDGQVPIVVTAAYQLLKDVVKYR